MKLGLVGPGEVGIDFPESSETETDLSDLGFPELVAAEEVDEDHKEAICVFNLKHDGAYAYARTGKQLSRCDGDPDKQFYFDTNTKYCDMSMYDMTYHDVA